MPSNVPAAIVHGADLDLNLGPPADLQDCYFDGDPSFKPAHETKSVYKNYLGARRGFVSSSPMFTMDVNVILKQQSGPFAALHPGSGITRNLVPCFAERTAHNFPAEVGHAGYFMVGDPTRSTPVGVHNKVTLPLELILFDVTDPSAGGV